MSRSIVGSCSVLIVRLWFSALEEAKTHIFSRRRRLQMPYIKHKEESLALLNQESKYEGILNSTLAGKVA